MSMLQVRKRASNMELLRLVAIFFVLVAHADYMSLGTPTWLDIELNPVEGGKVLIESIAIISVNLFILISGYFSVKLKVSSVLNFLYQCLFYSVGIYVVVCLLGVQDFEFKHLVQSLFCVTLSGLWFVKAYLGLLLFSPVLNAFIQKVDEKELRMFILMFTLFQSYFEFWGLNAEFQRGYSFVSFLNLYCIGRYIYLYRPRIFSLPKHRDLVVWLFFVSLIVLNALCNYKIPFISAFSYNNPLVIIASIYFFLFFSKISLDSTLINRLALSAFSVYLIHSNAYIIHYFKAVNLYLYDKSVLLVLLFLVLLFFSSIIVDQVRLYSFHWLKRRMTKG